MLSAQGSNFCDNSNENVGAQRKVNSKINHLDFDSMKNDSVPRLM